MNNNNLIICFDIENNNKLNKINLINWINKFFYIINMVSFDIKFSLWNK